MAIALHTAAEAEAVWVLGDSMSFRGRLPGTEWCMAEVLVPPGSGVPLHAHPGAELFRVLEGRLAFLRGAPEAVEAVEAGPGDVVEVPGEVAHGYRNAGETPAVVLVLFGAEMERFFRAAGTREAPPPGPPSDEALSRVTALAAAHRVRMLGAG